MKANELMIGDWVMRKQCFEENANIITDVYRVDAITKEDLYLREEDKRYISKYDNPEIVPIPLTAEILDKNCADIRKYEDNRSFQWTWENPDGYVELATRAGGDHISDGFFMSCNGGEYAIMVLHYVHELQHALRLCGIEKEIVL